jgi:hypothetical protein
MKGVRGIAAALGLVAVAATATPASAAEQLGSTSAAGACEDGEAWVQGDSVTGPDYRAGAPGVVTSWSTTASAFLNTYQFMVLRPDSGTTPPYGYTPMQKDIVRTITAVNVVNTFPGLHIPINTGETIGLFVPEAQPSGDGRCASAAPAGNSLQRFAGDPPLAMSSNFLAPQPTLKLNLAATVEPDADGDRFGDETQDGCPTDTAAQGACPVASTPTPTPTPTKKCKRKKSKKSASAAKKKKKRGCKKKKTKRK